MAGPNTARLRAGQRHLRNWARTFQAVGLKGATRKAMRAIGTVVTTSTIERMEHGVSPSGTPHKPLTERYKARKKAQDYSENIWQRTGESIGKVQVIKVTRRSVIVAINTPYSGWADRDGRVPRPVIGVSSDDVQQIKRILQRDLKEQLEG